LSPIDLAGCVPRRSSRLLGQRALGRALLARQLLLEPSDLSALSAVEHLVGLQAQAVGSPYVALFSRLRDADPLELSGLLERREVVRLALMRSTIHLVSAEDCLRLRPLMTPVIERGFASNWARRLEGLDPREVAAAGEAVATSGPCTFAQLGAILAERWPGHDPQALAMAVRDHVPLVQVPPRGLWRRSGPVAHVPAPHWLGRPLSSEASLEALVRRYLAAFGPASTMDVQKWSGLTRLSGVLEGLRGELLSFRDESGRELFDLPQAPRPDPETPAPVRFLPDWDNALLSHADRRRILPESVSSGMVMREGRVLGTVLVDGFVAATWRPTRSRTRVDLLVEPLQRLARGDRAGILQEGARLAAFLAAGGEDCEVAIGAVAPLS
jgi:hypothetical protein